MRKRLGVLVAAAAGAALYIALLPPAPLELTATGPRQPRGVFHVHTSRSDGAGTPADVAAAAARAGIDFVILTDHGDATRAPDPPAYVDGVLVIDAVEVSTTRGHVVALGLAEAAPYPLGGEGRDAVEDIQRLGGMAIAAHIGSPKPELQWTDPAAAIDGIEWINADSEWRDEGAWTLARVLLAYPGRSAAALGSVLDRPDPVLARWDTLLQARRVVGVAAVDAHARVGANEPYDGRISLRLPSYEAMFRTMTIALESATFSGDPSADAAAVVDALRRGAFFSTIDAIASPGELRITSTNGTLRVDSNAPADATIVLLRGGDMVTSAPGPVMEYALPATPAVYRVEVRVPSAPGMPPVPWLVSNAIDVLRPEAVEASAPAPPGVPGTTLFADGQAGAWTVERGGAAQAALDAISAAPAGEQLLFRFALGGRVSENPFAAAVVPVTGLADYRQVTFAARADAPMRLAVQLRAPSPGAGRDGERWRRSVFIDQTPRTITVSFDDLRPVPGAREGQVPLAAVDSLLFVVDLVHTPLGASGRVWLDDVRLER
ncbi:MAG: PHP domain-containing protein [Vicinamibacterales bacterium]